MVRPYLEQTGGKLNNDANIFTGGLNTYMDKAFLESNQMPYVMNLTMRQPPCMETRPFRLSLATYFGGTYPFSEKNILNMFMDSEIGYYLIVNDNGIAKLELYRDNGGTWEIVPLGSLGSIDLQYYFCHCWNATAHYLYVMNELGKYKYTIGGSLEPIEDDIYGIPEFHKGRLFIANPDTRVVTFSALYDFDNFDTEPSDDPLDNDYSVLAGDFKVTNAIGDVVGMKSFDDKLYVFCKNSMHLLYGSTPDISLPNSFQLVDLNNGIGAYSNRCITVGSDYLFWLGNDRQVYQHTGSYTYMISRPTEKGTGGIDNLFNYSYIGDTPQMCATSSRLYFNVAVSAQTYHQPKNNVLLVYDMYNKIWWAEDGEFTSIAEDRNEPANATLFMAKPNGDVLYETIVGAGGYVDEVYDFEQNKIVSQPIKYVFQTRAYGADGTDMRKTISDVWFQARANAEVYLGDLWTAKTHWDALPWDDDSQLAGYVKIGELKYRTQAKNVTNYDAENSEQQRAIVPKMYGQRVNAFSVVVTGEGKAEFYLMKRNWRVS